MADELDTKGTVSSVINHNNDDVNDGMMSAHVPRRSKAWFIGLLRFAWKSEIAKRLKPLVERLETFSKREWVAHTGYG